MTPETSEQQSTGEQTTDQQRVEARAEHLLPEETATSSDDPHAQAEAILADSDRREADQSAAPDTVLERRTSAEATGTTATPEPPD